MTNVGVTFIRGEPIQQFLREEGDNEKENRKRSMKNNFSIVFQTHTNTHTFNETVPVHE